MNKKKKRSKFSKLVKRNKELIIWTFILFVIGFIFAELMIIGLICGLIIRENARQYCEKEDNKRRLFFLSSFCFGSLLHVLIARYSDIIPQEFLIDGVKTTGGIITVIAFNWLGALFGGLVGFTGD